MPTGRALAIGLHRVDAARYQRALGDLPATEGTARKLLGLATAAGFVPYPLLLTTGATRNAVLTALAQAAQDCHAGDILFLAFSGHGLQYPADDHKDETWCLYDGELVDDEIAVALSQFDEDVRIIVISDSCHSGAIVFINAVTNLDVSSMRPYDVTTATVSEIGGATPQAAGSGKKLKRQKTKPRKTLPFVSVLTLPTDPIPAAIDARPIILLAASADDQDSATGGTARDSAFSAALLEVANDGSFRGDYASFLAQIRRKVEDRAQTPQLLTTARAREQFVSQRPFTI